MGNLHGIFSVVLLAGYAYSDSIIRYLKPVQQITLHATLLCASLIFLPIIPDPSWKPVGTEDPALLILVLLVSTIGLPYFLISTTGPLIQAWASYTHVSKNVYRFFALSNLASLVALVSYPFLIEPHTPLDVQAHAWSGVYAFLCTSCCCFRILFLSLCQAAPPATVVHDKKTEEKEEEERGPVMRDYLLWLSLSGIGSWVILCTYSR